MRFSISTVSIYVRAVAAACFLGALVQSASAASIGVNFATDGTGASFDLGPTDNTGVVPQDHWNNAHNSDATLSNLVDDLGNATGASITWGHSPISTNVAGGTPIGNLLHSAVIAGPADSIVVSNIPYSTFDLYLYISAPNTSPTTVLFKINHGIDAGHQLSVSGIADHSPNPVFVPSTLQNTGSYLFLGGVSGSTLYIGGSGGPVVDGLQIMEAPEPTSLALLVCAGLGLAAVCLRRRKTLGPF